MVCGFESLRSHQIQGLDAMTDEVKKVAQEQAEEAFNHFMLLCKRGTYVIVFSLCLVVFACNNGVETGPGKTGSQYNGEQYNPSNLNVKK